MKPFKATIFALCLALALLGGCNSNQGVQNNQRETPPTSPSPSPQLTNITVAHWGQEKILIYLPLYVAMDGGFFKQQGLNVTLKYSGNDDQVFATVISGQAQFGVGDPTFTAISREKGGTGKVVATLVGAVANWGVTNKQSISEINDPHQLDGLRVTSFPSPSTTFTILSEIKKTLNLQRMNIKQLAFGTEFGALERGDADLAIMLEPQASVAESKGYRVVWSVAKYYGPFALTGVTTTDEMIKNNPDQVQRMVNGIQAALDYIRSNPDRTLEIAAQNFPTLDRTVVKNAIARMTQDASIPADARITTEAWKKTLTVRNKMGDLQSVEKGMEAVDNTFAEKALTPEEKKRAQAAAHP
jgi:NitT/TauT family transport system substrate-binding protein